MKIFVRKRHVACVNIKQQKQRQRIKGEKKKWLKTTQKSMTYQL